MTLDQWHGSLAPKVRGTKNLHNIFGSNVDFFIMMSSVVCLRGNIGQSNYAAACSFQDAFARHRRAMGAPAWSINVGPVTEVGFVSENPEVAETLKRRGLGSISVAELLALLNYAVANPATNESVCAIGLLPEFEPVTSEDESVKDRRYAHLVRHDGAVRKVEGATDDVLQLLDGAARFEDAAEIICSAILQQLGKLIATPVESLSAAQSLDSYGVDSLVAVELRNWIGAYLQANVQLMVLRGTPSIKELAKIVTTESRLVSFKTG
jgi:aryl carrier-like protein